MLFNSYEFIFIFLPFTILGYFLLARIFDIRKSKYFLILMSLIFYSYWDIRNLPILAFSILINYIVGTKIKKTRNRSLLLTGILFNILLLIYYKYSNFLINNINIVLDQEIPSIDVVLPLGISFFTFTQTAYLVDSYRAETEKYSKSDYLLFVTIFPHLIAGPIIYHKDMIPQFSDLSRYKFNSLNFARGIVWFVIGLFKKVVIADRLSTIADLAFLHPSQLSFFDAWGGSLAYTLQLFFDFSAYSEMAIGIALMFNYDIPVNFNAPYKACNIIDFWKRWHITLSTFLKNYLYIPLGGNRNGHHLRNILITMLLGGIWHGAGWTFIIWGGLHGFFICINHIWRKFNIAIPRIISWLLTFNAVNFAWIFFRASTIDDAFCFIKSMFTTNGIAYPYSNTIARFLPNITYSSNYLVSSNDLLRIITFFVISVAYFSTEDWITYKFKPKILIAILLAAAFVFTVSQLNKMTTFLYFQF